MSSDGGDGAAAVQAKLEVSGKNDAFEREADHVAEEVARTPVGGLTERGSAGHARGVGDNPAAAERPFVIA